jgi:DNA gyrase subunit B
MHAEITENLALAGAFDKSWMKNAAKAKTLTAQIDKIFKNTSSNEDVSWSSQVNESDDIEIIKETRGVKTSYLVKNSYFDMPESIAIAQVVEQIMGEFASSVKFIRGEEERIAHKPLELMGLILETGKKGVSIQRFKGLGEMNAEQLWETTLDPANRTLLQVKVDQYDEADQTFSTLMGNVVEPRRDFIQENALKVVNLDV